MGVPTVVTMWLSRAACRWCFTLRVLDTPRHSAGRNIARRNSNRSTLFFPSRFKCFQRVAVVASQPYSKGKWYMRYLSLLRRFGPSGMGRMSLLSFLLIPCHFGTVCFVVSLSSRPNSRSKGSLQVPPSSLFRFSGRVLEHGWMLPLMYVSTIYRDVVHLA